MYRQSGLKCWPLQLFVQRLGLESIPSGDMQPQHDNIQYNPSPVGLRPRVFSRRTFIRILLVSCPKYTPSNLVPFPVPWKVCDASMVQSASWEA